MFHAFARRTASNPVSSFLPNLTARELEILRCRRRRLEQRDRTRAVRDRADGQVPLSNVYRKLGVSNRTEASHYAHVHGLIDATQAQPMRTLLRSMPAVA